MAASKYTALAAAREAYLGAVRALLAERVEKCHDECPGFVINVERMRIERCDECAQLNGYADTIADEDVAALPEAHKLLADTEANLDEYEYEYEDEYEDEDENENGGARDDG